MIQSRVLMHQQDFEEWLRDVRVSHAGFTCSPPLRYPCVVSYKSSRAFLHYHFLPIAPAITAEVKRRWMEAYPTEQGRDWYFFLTFLQDVFDGCNKKE
jgi:hypothetical protein